MGQLSRSEQRHAICRMPGALYDSHHGLTNAVLPPVVLRYNRDALSISNFKQD